MAVLEIIMVWIKAAFIELITRLHNIRIYWFRVLYLNNVNAVDFLFHESISILSLFLLLGCFSFMHTL